MQGLETSTPFLKLGNQVYHGKISDPIGDEIILERNRSELPSLASSVANNHSPGSTTEQYKSSTN